MRIRLLLPAVGNGLPSLYHTTAGTGLPLVRQRRIRRCDFFTVTDSSSPNAAGALAASEIKQRFDDYSSEHESSKEPALQLH